MQRAATTTLSNDFTKTQETHETRSAHARGSAAAQLFDVQPYSQPYLARGVQAKICRPLLILLLAGRVPAGALHPTEYLVQWTTLPADSQVEEEMRNFFIHQPVLRELVGNNKSSS
jgi:hypothetical protein